MKTPYAALICAFVLGAVAVPAAAAVTPFDLQGSAGAGLLGGNESPNAVVGGGSGGEVGAGISFDSGSNLLTINIGWGSVNFFNDLTGNALAGHIHGPTPSDSPASFNEAVGVLTGLSSLAGWNNSATGGGFLGTVPIAPTNVAHLFAGRLYINIHTATNGGGEIRGNLMPVPEPASFAMLGVGLALVAGLARRRRGT